MSINKARRLYIFIYNIINYILQYVLKLQIIYFTNYNTWRDSRNEIIIKTLININIYKNGNKNQSLLHRSIYRSVQRSWAGALENLHILPIGNLEFGLVFLVKIEYFDFSKFARCATWPWGFTPVFLRYETLEKCVMMSWIIARWTASFAETSVKMFRLDYEVETFQFFEGDAHPMATTAFRTFSTTFRSTTSVKWG